MKIKCIPLFFENATFLTVFLTFLRALKMGLSRLSIYSRKVKIYITLQTIFQVLYHCVLQPMFQLQNQSKNLLKNVK